MLIKLWRVKKGEREKRAFISFDRLVSNDLGMFQPWIRYQLIKFPQRSLTSRIKTKKKHIHRKEIFFSVFKLVFKKSANDNFPKLNSLKNPTEKFYRFFLFPFSLKSPSVLRVPGFLRLDFFNVLFREKKIRCLYLNVL